MRIAITRNPALIVVDVQRDFMPGGSLPVPNGDSVIDPLNMLINYFEAKGLPIIFTRDWHPPDHTSFKEMGGPWPKHCVQGTEGAEFHPGLKVPRGLIIISKATDKDKEAYSGFEGTELDKILREKSVRRLFIGGVATEYCVKATVLDALRLGYEVVVVDEAVKGIKQEEEIRAKEEVVREGAILIRMNEILR